MEELKQGCKIEFVGVYKDNSRRAMPGTANKATPNDATPIMVTAGSMSKKRVRMPVNAIN